jgi:hypothetical protein
MFLLAKEQNISITDIIAIYHDKINGLPNICVCRFVIPSTGSVMVWNSKSLFLLALTWLKRKIWSVIYLIHEECQCKSRTIIRCGFLWQTSKTWVMESKKVKKLCQRQNDIESYFLKVFLTEHGELM